MTVEYYSFLYHANPKAAEEIENEDFDQDAILAAMENNEDWEDL